MRCSDVASEKAAPESAAGMRPNKRLKLAGAHQYERVALPRRRTFFSAAPPPCASGDCARSLSAIR